MKNLIVVLTLMIGSVFASNAQTPQTSNAGFVGYSFYTNDVAGKFGTLNYNKSTDAHGFNASYTRFFAGGTSKNTVNTVGFTADFGANFNGKNESSLVTVMAGLTAQARNSKYVQPYARALAGVARQNVRLNNVIDFSDTSMAYALVGGLDFNLKAYSRYKLRVGADFLSTGFGGNRHSGTRITTGLVF
ncbi:hypothetical protein BH09PAT1_BH09PAT1_8090 [soil metagenome]